MIIDKEVDLMQAETYSLQRESLINTKFQKPSRERVWLRADKGPRRVYIPTD